jgi:hypothetical protein
MRPPAAPVLVAWSFRHERRRQAAAVTGRGPDSHDRAGQQADRLHLSEVDGQADRLHLLKSTARGESGP